MGSRRARPLPPRKQLGNPRSPKCSRPQKPVPASALNFDRAALPIIRAALANDRTKDTMATALTRGLADAGLLRSSQEGTVWLAVAETEPGSLINATALLGRVKRALGQERLPVKQRLAVEYDEGAHAIDPDLSPRAWSGHGPDELDLAARVIARIEQGALREVPQSVRSPLIHGVERAIDVSCRAQAPANKGHRLRRSPVAYLRGRSGPGHRKHPLRDALVELHGYDPYVAVQVRELLLGAARFDDNDPGSAGALYLEMRGADPRLLGYSVGLAWAMALERATVARKINKREEAAVRRAYERAYERAWRAEREPSGPSTAA